MSCRSTKGRYLANKSRCIITLITEYLTWLVKTKTWGNFKKKKTKKGKEDHRWWQVPAGDGMGVSETWDERGTRRRGKGKGKMRDEKRAIPSETKGDIGRTRVNTNIARIGRARQHGAFVFTCSQGSRPTALLLLHGHWRLCIPREEPFRWGPSPAAPSPAPCPGDAPSPALSVPQDLLQRWDGAGAGQALQWRRQKH